VERPKRIRKRDPEEHKREFCPMDEKKLPLTSHLQELRKRLILSFIAIGVGFCLCYAFADKIFNILAAPLMDILKIKGGSLIFISVAEAFFTYMKVAFIAGIIVTSPFILYQIWAFVAPGLYQKEKRYVVPFVLGGSLFFALGVLFGYYVAIPVGFKFLLGYATDFIKPMPSMKEYLSFSIKFLLAFGLVFEFPVVLVLLSKIGIIDAKILARQRKYAILLIFVFAAVMTPPDFISQVLMALPLIGLYELSILLSKIFGKKSTPIPSEGDGNKAESPVST
jgi:sec-independent protein translocase protein TatC